MNDRIKELMVKASSGACYDEPGSITLYNDEIEKFAELIIRECAEVCMKEIDTGWAMAPKSPWMANQILDHFGVE